MPRIRTAKERNIEPSQNPKDKEPHMIVGARSECHGFAGIERVNVFVVC